MCILVVKNSGVRKMTDKEIRTCGRTNPDGFGISYFDRVIHTYHSMDIEDVIEWNKHITTDMPVIYHFRIATHGSVKLSNCHPFTDRQKTWTFAHNGILSIQNLPDKTDSETFFLSVLPLLNVGIEPGSHKFDRVVNEVLGCSKFAFMNNKGEIFTYGQFIKDDLLFSNTSYIDWEDRISTRWDSRRTNLEILFDDVYQAVMENPDLGDLELYNYFWDKKFKKYRNEFFETIEDAKSLALSDFDYEDGYESTLSFEL